jgi:hypothetical protein
VDTYISVVDVADCVEGHVLAATRGRPGERYVLNGATITSDEALALLQELSGFREDVRMLPPALVRAAAALGEAAYRAGAARRRCAAPGCARSCTGTATTARAPAASSGSSTRRWPRRSAHDRVGGLRRARDAAAAVAPRRARTYG